MQPLRVLIIAEAANPALTSVALIGYSLSQALAEVCDVHLVTERRNAASLLNAGVDAGSFTAITNPAQRIAFRIATILRGGTSLGWTIHSALTTLAYPLFERKVWRHFSARLANGDFDLVHRITPLSPTTPSYLAKKLAKIGVPFILGPLNGGIPWPSGFERIRRAEREWLGYFRDLYRILPGLKATRKYATALVLASRHTYAEVTAKQAQLEHKAIWLPENAIDPTRFPEVLVEPARPPAGGPLRIAFLGRLVPYKGADILLDAVAPLVREGKVTVEIIGDGPHLPELKAIVARENLGDAVMFAGWVAHAQVRRHLAKAQIFAFPSVREFGGGVVLEAMALGLVPVVIDYGGPAELIPEGCGTIVPMGKREELVGSFRRVLADLTTDPAAVHATGLRAQQHVRAHFTWSAKAKQLHKVYAWTLQGTPALKPDLWGDTR
ncbi:MAG: glycosyltransferase family 4 protein [Verrucomicrobiota bacterium]